VWVGAVLIYGFHRLYQSFGFPEPRLFQFYLNDLLFIPAVLPLVAAVESRLGWRELGPPKGTDVLFYGAIWSLICEWVGPFAFGMGSPDPWDVVAYAAGGLVAWVFWKRSETQLARAQIT